MEEQDKDLELYIPEAKLNDNVKRMAWLLFLEWWKDAVKNGGMQESMKADMMHSAYGVSLQAAKVVWHEQEKGYEQS